MATNCLVTTLKESVNNSNLPKLGVLTIKRYAYHGGASVSNVIINTNFNTAVTKIVTSDSVFTTGADMSTSIGTTLNWYTARYVQSSTQSAECTIEISNKYALTNLTIGGDFGYNLDELIYNSLTAIYNGTEATPASTGHISGELINLKDSYNSLVKLCVPCCDVKINATDFCNFTALTTINISENRKTSGTIVEMVQAYRAKGVTSGSLTYRGKLTGLNASSSVAMSVNTSGYTGTIAWTASTITVTDPTNMKIYANGATSEQIAQWEQGGYEVTVF